MHRGRRKRREESDTEREGRREGIERLGVREEEEEREEKKRS